MTSSSTRRIYSCFSTINNPCNQCGNENCNTVAPSLTVYLMYPLYMIRPAAALYESATILRSFKHSFPYAK